MEQGFHISEVLGKWKYNYTGRPFRTSLCEWLTDTESLFREVTRRGFFFLLGVQKEINKFVKGCSARCCQ